MTSPQIDNNLIALRHFLLALLTNAEYTGHDTLHSAMRNMLLRIEDVLNEPHTYPTRKERRDGK